MSDKTVPRWLQRLGKTVEDGLLPRKRSNFRKEFATAVEDCGDYEKAQNEIRLGLFYRLQKRVGRST